MSRWSTPSLMSKYVVSTSGVMTRAVVLVYTLYWISNIAFLLCVTESHFSVELHISSSSHRINRNWKVVDLPLVYPF